MSLKNRAISKPSKASTYRGNGRTYSMYAGVTLSRELTDEEKLVESELHRKYDPILGEFEFHACTNMGKPSWFVRVFDCREIETNAGPHELAGEIDRWLLRAYPDVAKEYGICQE
jgi:hypothetical protein